MLADAVDRLLVETLQREGRVTYSDLATRVGLTAAPTQARVAKLESTGVITGYAAKVDRTKIGYTFLAFVSVILRNHEPDEEDAFEAAAAAIPQIQEIHHVSGEEDYLLKVIARDTTDFEKLLRRTIGAIPQVQRVKTTLVLSTAKSTTACPVDVE
ncbi:Lrp/AsnC family transcriptional regulator [bacterium]|nr:MAG: Lrp/AsnC family transcriptional regulator [bacterium]